MKYAFSKLNIAYFLNCDGIIVDKVEITLDMLKIKISIFCLKIVLPLFIPNCTKFPTEEFLNT